MHGVFAALVPTQASGGNTPDFAVSVSPNNSTVKAGQSTSFTLGISPTNGFNSALSFSCSGLPTGASCVFSTQNYSPGAGTTTPTLTIRTSARTGAALRQGPSIQFRGGFWMPLALGFVGLFLAWLYFRAIRSHITFPALIRTGGLVVILVSLIAAAGCGSANSNSGTPRSTSTVTVTATAGTLSHSTSITLNVQ
jgi:hypothetical protein